MPCLYSPFQRRTISHVRGLATNYEISGSLLFRNNVLAKPKKNLQGTHDLIQNAFGDSLTVVRTHIHRAFAELKFYLPQLTQSMWHHQVSAGRSKCAPKNLFEAKALEMLLLEQCVPIHWIVGGASSTNKPDGFQDIFSPLLLYTMTKVKGGVCHFCLFNVSAFFQ